jgi:hypothetical protein
VPGRKGGSQGEKLVLFEAVKEDLEVGIKIEPVIWKVLGDT